MLKNITFAKFLHKILAFITKIKTLPLMNTRRI